MEGLRQKLEDQEFISFLVSFDIVCLTETFIDYALESLLFKDYSVYTAKARKLMPHANRPSGGVIMLVKNIYSEFVCNVDVLFDNMIVLEADERLFGHGKKTYLIGVYIPPCESRSYDVTENGYGMEPLEQCILDLHERCSDFNMIMMGDFNGRTGCQNGLVNFNADDNDADNADDCYERKSKDSVVNTFGQQLLEMCSSFDCSIINGLTDWSFDDGFTYIHPRGSSVIDYFVISNNLCTDTFLQSFCVAPRVDSTHLPIVLKVQLPNLIGTKVVNGDVEWVERYVWDPQKENTFIESLSSLESQACLDRAMDELESSIDTALNTFSNTVLSAAGCMKKRFKTGQMKKDRSPWFDSDCYCAKKEAQFSLKQFKKTNTADDRQAFTEKRKAYKKIIKERKAVYKQSFIQNLQNKLNDPKAFWGEIRSSLGSGKSKTTGDITDEEWVNHFKHVFSSDSAQQPFPEGRLTDDMQPLLEPLNRPITEDEVKGAIKRLKKQKASGCDQIMAEMLKLNSTKSFQFLTKCFNLIFSSGVYPAEWAKSVIVPLHKKGDSNSPDNYRGISLLSVISKCYTSILNKRLKDWMEENEKIVEEQAGFRKGFSTADHIFTLSAIIEKMLSRNGCKLYVAFIDLAKAFDSVNRVALFESLIRAGLSGTFFNALKAIYFSVVSCIKVNNHTTDFFNCPLGLKQGCTLSPSLFSLFINEIATEMNGAGKHGVQMLPGMLELFLLLFADDIALLATTPVGLQNQLNLLHQLCEVRSLKINKDKTKVMVFRKGGYLAKDEVWFLGGQKLEVVNNYTYLGYTFTTMLSANQAVSRLALKGKKAAFNCIRALRKFSDISKSCFFKLFDIQIQPIMMYGAEVWGAHHVESVEKVHTMVCKRFLNVPLRTPNKLVYGELGRYPLFINSCVRTVKYWLRILAMNDERLPKQAYKMLLKVDENAKQCWVTRLKTILCNLGFNEVWNQQSVGHERAFLVTLKERLIAQYNIDWWNAINSSDRFNVYFSFKTILCAEQYFEWVSVKCFRDALVKLRLGVLPINVNKFRFSDNDNAKICQCCNRKVVEDEYHFVCICPLYAEYRFKYFGQYWCSRDQMLRMLYCDSQTQTASFAAYIFYAFKKRQQYCLNALDYPSIEFA